ncbi:GntR family transcriptional regulator [Actinoallomurus oryzae]|uniref:GntR family transcriptional regulator n=1 Tax=Actinoallomurus oryzae TaxID=502180 RepID=A0ABP8PJS2_9ACTN
MTTTSKPSFALSDADRSTLLAWAAQDDGALSLRSRIVLALADGQSNKDVAARLGVSPATVGKWRSRFAEHGLDGLADAPRSGRPRSVEREEAERLIAVALSEAERGGTVPSTHALARSLGLSQSTVSRIYRDLQEAGPLEMPAGSPQPQAVPGADADLLPRELLSDRVYEMLRRWIVEGRLTAGQRLSESEIARRLGTSQAPAREAIKRLVHEGLVRYLPHRGNYVAQISQEQAREVRDVRLLLEEHAARSATARIEPQTLQRLTEDVERMRRAAGRGDIGGFRDADMAFHRDVCAASGNSFLLRVWRMIEPSLWGLHVLGNPLYAGDWVAMAEHHATLLTALAGGDPDEAGRLFAAHVRGESTRT